MRGWLSAGAPKLVGFGLLRLVRDVLGVSGFVEFTANGAISRLVLNGNSNLARLYLRAFHALLRPQRVSVRLGGT